MKKLGPSRICNFRIAKFLKKKTHRTCINKFITASNAKWTDDYLSEIKRLIRLELRQQQDGRCMYCRRIMKVERRNTTEDIEHYLDKSKAQFRKWAFSSFNLSLACHSCNMEKSNRSMLQNGYPLTCYPKDPCAFVWLHPVLDDYHANIKILEGWIYEVRSVPNTPDHQRALALIQDCKLDQVSTIEERAQLVMVEVARLNVLMGKLNRRSGKTRSMNVIIERQRTLIDEGRFDL